LIVENDVDDIIEDDNNSKKSHLLPQLPATANQATGQLLVPAEEKPQTCNNNHNKCNQFLECCWRLCCCCYYLCCCCCCCESGVRISKAKFVNRFQKWLKLVTHIYPRLYHHLDTS